jgi:hypothetical protein
MPLQGRPRRLQPGAGTCLVGLTQPLNFWLCKAVSPETHFHGLKKVWRSFGVCDNLIPTVNLAKVGRQSMNGKRPECWLVVGNKPPRISWVLVMSISRWSWAVNGGRIRSPIPIAYEAVNARYYTPDNERNLLVYHDHSQPASHANCHTLPYSRITNVGVGGRGGGAEKCAG